ncbi:heavy metal-associated domain-containing protein [Paludisphaera sp.]|uniref:heavy-metal-associated domain-containing protein n=1 Tax=Paludisphaera sp. TaxID=2017432 RepID=UPI00301D1D3A
MSRAETTLKIQNVECEGCAGSVRAALSKLPGFGEARFDIPGKTVTIAHDPALDRAEVARALTAAGFPAE